MAAACALAIISGKLFLIEQCRSVCGRSGIAFSREGVVTANGSCRACFLRKRRRGGKVFAALDTFSTKGNGVRPLSQSLWLCQLSQRESQEHCRKRILFSPETLTIRLTACALSVTCGDSSPKGRAKSTAGNFLITLKTSATNLTAWLPLWGSWRGSA